MLLFVSADLRAESALGALSAPDACGDRVGEVLACGTVMKDRIWRRGIGKLLSPFSHFLDDDEVAVGRCSRRH